MSDIIVKFKPDGHTDLIKAINNLKGAQQGQTVATQKQIQATNKASKSLGVFATRNKRNAKSMSKLGLAFSTVRSKMLLLNFAVGLGIQQMIQLAKESTKLKNMETAFNTLTSSAESSSVGISKLRGATRGTVSDFNLLQQANNAMILGVTKNTDEMAHMFNMAKRLGDALGRDAASSVESLITGIGRQSRLMLDNIGIIVKSDEAYKKYAQELNKTSDQLTDAEKKQAFLNATIEAAEKKVSKLPPATKKTSDKFNEFGATLKNVSLELGNTIAPALGSVALSLSNFINNILLSDTEILLKDLQDIGIATKDLKQITEALTLEDAFKEFQESSKRFEDEFQNMLLGLLDAPVNLRPLNIYRETIEKMGGSARHVNNDISAFFDNMEDLDVTEMSTGVKHLTSFMTSLSVETAALKKQNIFLQKAIDDGTITQKMSREEAEKTIKSNLKDIQLRRVMTNNAEDQLKMLVGLISNTIKFQNAQNILNGTIFESKKNEEDKIKLFPTTIANLDKESILTQNLKNVKAQLLEVKNRENKSQKEKLKADKEAVSLQKQQLSIEKELRKLKNDNIDANLKAANAVGNFALKAGKAAKASAMEIAAIEATMSIIHASGAFLKTLNSDMMLTNPIATKIMAAANLAAGLAQSAIIIQQAKKVGASSSGGETFGSFEHGGYVGGRRHSQGGTIIEAERGEFVMSRNAVESIGLETLNQMNQGGGTGNIVVNVSGNVMTQDFVEGELAEAIKEAARRGSDFGLS